MDCLFLIEELDGASNLTVTLHLDGQLAGKESLDFNANGQSLQPAFQALKLATCPREQIKGIGEQLFFGLLPRTLRTAFNGALKERLNKEKATGIPAECVRLCLVMPERLRDLPWEALFDRRLSYLGVLPEWTLRHQPTDEDRELVGFPTATHETLRILLVIPLQTNLDFAQECEAITRAFAQLDPAFVQVERMSGGVTLRALRDKLDETTWDIVHYIGHGLPGGTIFLNSSTLGGVDSVDGNSFANSFVRRGVRLVVLSCCFGASTAYSEAQSLTALGSQLVGVGVPAVVAMRYAVSDRAATEFAGEFYATLLHHSSLGEVDSAVQAGRRALECLRNENESRAFITPVLLAVPEGLKLPVPQSRGINPSPIVSHQRVTLPDALVASLQKGDCLIIAGNRLAQVGATRDLAMAAHLPPSLDTLIRELAAKPKKPYPRTLEIPECEHDDALAWEIFERVCQYFKSCADGGRLNLLSWVVEAFVHRHPPAIFEKMAHWDVGGIIYTHLDGFLREAARKVGGWDFLDTPRDRAPGERRTLVLLRGYPAARSQLRVTREDSWELIENISHMDDTVKTLARERSNVVLLLGISPADALVQFLVNVLLGEETQRKEKPLFFAAAEPDPVVQACWHRFENKTWLGDLSLEDLVMTIDSIVRKGV